MKRHYYITPDDYARAEANGINKRTLERRVREFGWDIERAVNTPILSRNKLNESMVKLAEKNGVSRRLYARRIKELGWTEEQAASVPPMSRKEVGKENAKRATRFTDKQLQIMKKNGLKKVTVLNRVNRNGWTMEEAINTPTVQPHELGEWRKRKKRNRGFLNDGRKAQ